MKNRSIKLMALMCAVLAMSGCSTQRNVSTSEHVTNETVRVVSDTVRMMSIEEVTQKLHGREKIHVVWYEDGPAVKAAGTVAVEAEGPNTAGAGRVVMAEAWIERDTEEEKEAVNREHVEATHDEKEAEHFEEEKKRDEKIESKNWNTNGGWRWMLLAGMIAGIWLA